MDNTISLKNNKYIELIPKNANIIKINTSTLDINVQKFNDNIISLLFKDDYEIRVGNIIPITFKQNKEKLNISKYKVNYIIKEKGCFYLVEEFINKITKYLLPGLGENKNYWNLDYHIVNTYLLKKENFIDINYLYIKCRFVSSNNYLEFEKKIKEHELYNSCFEYKDYYTIYKFKIPDKLKKNAELILEGKYSHISNELKKKICGFYRLTKKDHIYKVLYKSLELKNEMEIKLGINLENSELESKPTIKKEILLEDETIKIRA